MLVSILKYLIKILESQIDGVVFAADIFKTRKNRLSKSIA